MQTVTLLALIAALSNVTLAAEPLAIHPNNPHYFVFQGKPTVLVTSGEHYGAVLNSSFDYVKYLDTLAKDKLNLTRIFCGQYREVPGSFNITGNTLAPEEPQFLTPYKRVAPQRYDLRTWNDAYWSRLKDFVSQASKRGIVVEVTLFTTYYNDTHWGLSPLNAANNLQGIGKVGSKEPLTMKDPALVAVEAEFVRKIVTELKDADNVYYEICNEPYFWGPTEEWQRHIASVITETERKLGVRHLISRNIANGKAEIKDPDSSISIFNFHYARPPETVKMNWALSKPIGLNETGFDGPFDAPYRIQAWDFLLAGGALYNNLDYSFTVGREDGSFGTLATQPGGGSPKLRSQLRTLIEFFQGFDFIRMKPDETFIAGSLPAGASARAISEPGRAYALYLHHGRPLSGHQPQYVVETKRHRTAFAVTLPEGSYKIRWIDPQSGKVLHEGPVTSNGTATLSTPEYSQDIAADLRQN